MTERTEDDHSALWERPGFLLRRLHQIHVSLFFEECSNITPVQYGLLSILIDSPPIDQLRLAEKLGVDRTNVGDVLDRLEKRGLVSRCANPADRRMRLVTITESGTEFVRTNYAAMQRAQARLLEPLNEADRSLLHDLLTRLVNGSNHHGRTSLRAHRD